MDDIRNPSAPVDKSRKYALSERERRFLLGAVPAGEIVRTAQITDNYLPDTRLRIRRSIETAGATTTVVYKLTQKVPAPDGSPGLITTIYLSEAEYDLVATLPARQVRKTRYSIPPFGVDVFDPPLDGLILAEAGFETDEAQRTFAAPLFALAEVTHDLRFTGGRLVTTVREELLLTLASFGIDVVG